MDVVYEQWLEDAKRTLDNRESDFLFSSHCIALVVRMVEILEKD